MYYCSSIVQCSIISRKSNVHSWVCWHVTLTKLPLWFTSLSSWLVGQLTNQTRLWFRTEGEKMSPLTDIKFNCGISNGWNKPSHESRWHPSSTCRLYCTLKEPLCCFYPLQKEGQVWFQASPAARNDLVFLLMITAVKQQTKKAGSPWWCSIVQLKYYFPLDFLLCVQPTKVISLEVNRQHPSCE